MLSIFHRNLKIHHMLLGKETKVYSNTKNCQQMVHCIQNYFDYILTLPMAFKGVSVGLKKHKISWHLSKYLTFSGEYWTNSFTYIPIGPFKRHWISCHGSLGPSSGGIDLAFELRKSPKCSPRRVSNKGWSGVSHLPPVRSRPPWIRKNSRN